MAKIQIKSDKLTPFGGIFSIMDQFDSTLSSVIDSSLGLRYRSFGYQYSEIIRSLMSIYFCGGACIEDVTTHLMNYLTLHPTLRTCSSDTILRAIKKLTQENISHTSDTGKNYDFNTVDTLNTLLLNCMFASGQLKEGEMYDVDFDHQFIETEKYDARPTCVFEGYKKKDELHLSSSFFICMFYFYSAAFKPFSIASLAYLLSGSNFKSFSQYGLARLKSCLS